MTTRHLETLPNGNVKVVTEYAGASGPVTIEAEFTKQGSHVFKVLPGGLQLVCRNVSARGPALLVLPGSRLENTLRQEYRIRDAGETYGVHELATWAWSGATQAAVLLQALLGWTLALAAPPLVIFFFGIHHLGLSLLGALLTAVLGAGLLWNAGLRHPEWLGRILLMMVVPILWDVWWFGQPVGFLR